MAFSFGKKKKKKNHTHTHERIGDNVNEGKFNAKYSQLNNNSLIYGVWYAYTAARDRMLVCDALMR